MTFYHEYVGGELTLTKIGDTTMKGRSLPDKRSRLSNAYLKSSDTEISATDWYDMMFL